MLTLHIYLVYVYVQHQQRCCFCTQHTVLALTHCSISMFLFVILILYMLNTTILLTISTTNHITVKIIKFIIKKNNGLFLHRQYRHREIAKDPRLCRAHRCPRAPAGAAPLRRLYYSHISIGHISLLTTHNTITTHPHHKKLQPSNNQLLNPTYYPLLPTTPPRPVRTADPLPPTARRRPEPGSPGQAPACQTRQTHPSRRPRPQP